MTDDTTDDFDWGPLGAAWWADAGKQLGAKPRQLKFAAAKHRGCTNTEAARQAGYGNGDSNSIRATGYRLARSNITERLLAFASAEGQGYDNTVDRAEGRRILSSLARGSDPSVRIRAVEQLTKLDERDGELGQSQELDGLAEDRVIRDLLQMPGGAAAAVCLHMGKGTAISRIALLHDVHKTCMADPIAKVAWDMAVNRCSSVMQQDLRNLLSRPDWQLRTRIKLWREIGIECEVPKNIDLSILTEEPPGETHD